MVDSLCNSISQSQVYNVATGFEVFKLGDIAILKTVGMREGSFSGWAMNTLFQLPENLRPSRKFFGTLTGETSNGTSASFYVEITKSGSVVANPLNYKFVRMYGQVVYLLV